MPPFTAFSYICSDAFLLQKSLHTKSYAIVRPTPRSSCIVYNDMTHDSDLTSSITYIQTMAQQHYNNLSFLTYFHLLPPLPLTALQPGGSLPGRHISMYLPAVCLSATVANQFLINHLKVFCYTFHFPSSKLQGKLACQEDERKHGVEESNVERMGSRGRWEKKEKPNTYN